MRKLYIILLISIIITAVAVITFPYWYKSLFPQRIKIADNTVLPADIKADSVVVYKQKREMMLFRNGKVLKRYNISLGKNPEGHKEKEGDKKTPEGSYFISGRNPDSKYHYSLKISYPDEKDLKKAEELGVSPGGDIMIHGLPNIALLPEEYYINNDWTDGCIAVTDTEIDEIKETVNNGTKISIYK